MKCSKKTNIIENIIKIFEKLEKSQFAEEVLDSLDCDLEVLSEYLVCTKVQSALFCTVFGLQNKNGNAVSFSNIVVLYSIHIASHNVYSVYLSIENITLLSQIFK